METIQPYWYKLLYYWVYNMKRDGLTIPFIIGAKQEIETDYKANINDIDILLSSIISYTNDDNIVTLFYCDTIGELVLGLINRKQARYFQGNPILDDNTEFNNFIIGNGINLGTTTNEVCTKLKEKYALPITNRNFSIVHREWQQFTSSDKELIKNALNS